MVGRILRATYYGANSWQEKYLALVQKIAAGRILLDHTQFNRQIVKLRKAAKLTQAK